MKIFNKYETKDVKVKDPGLKKYINLKEKLVLKSHGRNTDKFSEADVSIIERLVNLLCVPGHRGKKQKIQTRWATGKKNKNIKVVLKALEIIKEKAGKNPVQVLVNAIENASPKDETTTIEYGGARYPQAVDTSPVRRVNLALRNIVHAAYDKTFNSRGNLEKALADEILAASNNNNESKAIKKKTEMEKQADSAR